MAYGPPVPRSPEEITVAPTATTPSAGTTDVSSQDDAVSAPEADDRGVALIEDELLVEEVSIDGMCGVY